MNNDELPELPEWSKRDDLGGKVPSEIRSELLAFYRRGYENGSPAELWKEIFQLRHAIKGPEGYETWQDAAIAMKLELAALRAQPSAQELRELAEAALQAFHDHEYNDPAPPFNFKVWSAFEDAFKPKTCIALLDEIKELKGRLSEAADIAISNNNARMEEIDQLRNLLGRGYGKLIRFGVENTDPMLMDEIKLELMK